MTTSKIKIKLGAIEIDYEGSETFLKEELPQLLAAVSDLYAKSRGSFDIPSVTVHSTPPSLQSNEQPTLAMTTASVAAKLNVKSGPELTMAAAARLAFVNQEKTFKRQEILDEMKSATAYCKPS